MENKILNVEVTSEEQRNELIKQLQEMEFKKPLPSSWEEYLDTLDSVLAMSIESKCITLKSIASKYESMYKLEKLMEVYNDGWKPDYKNKNKKYVIYVFLDSVELGIAEHENHFLSFKYAETSGLFFKNFEPLIKQYFEID